MSLKVAFIGASGFSKDALLTLISLRAQICGIGTCSPLTFNEDYEDLTIIGSSNDIDNVYLNELSLKGQKDWLERISPDIIFCLGYPRLLNPDLLKIPKLGSIGFHPTQLPKNRGRHPIIWTLALGLEQTASTFFFLGNQADSGDIISQEIIEISTEETAASLYDKLKVIGMKQLREIWTQLNEGTLKSFPQIEKEATWWRKRSKQDGTIDWRMSAKTIDALVRALGKPYSGAEFIFENRSVKVHETIIIENQERFRDFEPGKVIEVTSTGPLVKCGYGAIILKEMSEDLYLEAHRYLL